MKLDNYSVLRISKEGISQQKQLLHLSNEEQDDLMGEQELDYGHQFSGDGGSGAEVEQMESLSHMFLK